MEPREMIPKLAEGFDNHISLYTPRPPRDRENAIRIQVRLWGCSQAFNPHLVSRHDRDEMESPQLPPGGLGP